MVAILKKEKKLALIISLLFLVKAKVSQEKIFWVHIIIISVQENFSFHEMKMIFLSLL